MIANQRQFRYGRDAVRLFCLLPLLAAVGCNTLTYAPPNGGYLTRTAIGTKNSISELHMTFTNGAISSVDMRGYKNDQVQGLEAVARGVAAGLSGK